MCSHSSLLPVSLAEIDVDKEIEILSYTGFIDSLRWYRVVGEVKNVGSKTLGDVNVTVTLYDSNNHIIVSRQVQTELSVVEPNRITPFTFYLTDVTQSSIVDRCEAKVSSCNEAQPKEAKLKLYSIYNPQAITGEINNEGTSETVHVTVIATFYDQNKRVIETGSTDIYRLGSYQSESFTIYYPPPDISNKSIFERARWYSITAESYEYVIDKETGLIDFLFSPFAKFDVLPGTDVYVGQTVTFNASNSYDLDGYIANYTWDFNDGNVTSVSNRIISHSYSINGTYIVKLVVTDNDGLNSTATLSIVVHESANNGGSAYSLFLFFGIYVGISAAILFIAIFIAKRRHKPHRRRLKTSYKVAKYNSY
jgi:hypothetical protein